MPKTVGATAENVCVQLYQITDECRISDDRSKVCTKAQQAATAGMQYHLSSLYQIGKSWTRAVLWGHVTKHDCVYTL